MRLEMCEIDIRDVQFNEQTTIQNKSLLISKNELRSILSEDKRLGPIHLDIARPGEKKRIVKVFDVIEPRAKLHGSGEDFPGFIGTLQSAGNGVTRALKGPAVVVCDLGLSGMGTIIEMSGPAAAWGLYGSTQNIVVAPEPAPGVSRTDYLHALRLAGLKAAVYLASPEQEFTVNNREVFTLGPLKKSESADLPRVAYCFQIFSRQHGMVKGESVLYGGEVVDMLPTVLHPNEVIDGALVKDYYQFGFETYSIQNHPIIRKLYARHLRELIFAGVIVTTATVDAVQRNRNAIMIANLLSETLRADGVVISKIFGGAPNIDVGIIGRALEHRHIAAVPLIQIDSVEGDLGDALLFRSPSFDGVVCTGRIHEELSLPAVPEVLGAGPERDLGGAASIEGRYLRGMVNNLGASNLTITQY